MATKIVGLDMGTHTVKVCELVTTFRHYELVGFGVEPVGGPPDEKKSLEELAAAARRLLERRGLLNETLMCALPPGMTSTVLIELPFEQPKKIEQVLPFQLDELLPVPIEDVVFDYQIAERRGDKGCAVLVAYCRREAFVDFLGALEAQGIDPKVISIGPLSIFNLYDQIVGEQSQAAIGMVDIGHGHSELIIIDAGQPGVVRDLPGGGRDITQALAEAFHVEPAQAERGKHSEGVIMPKGQEDTAVDIQLETGASRQGLVARTCREAFAPILRELRRSLAAHERAKGHPVQRLYLTGGTSLLRGLPEYLEHELRVEVMLLDPLSPTFNRLPDGGVQGRPFMAKALALSMRAFNRAHQSQVNFRKGDFAYTGDFGFLQGRLIAVGAAVLLMIVLGAMGALTRKQMLEAEYQTLRQRAAAISMPLLGYESDDIDLLYTTITSQTQAEDSIPDVSAFEMLADMSEKIPFDLKVDLDSLEIDLDSDKLQVRGKTGSGADVERFVELLRSTRCFRGEIKKDRVEKATDDRTLFRLSATSTCS